MRKAVSAAFQLYRTTIGALPPAFSLFLFPFFQLERRSLCADIGITAPSSEISGQETLWEVRKCTYKANSHDR